MRGAFAVDEPRGPRWQVALELLGRGDAFSLGRITFSKTGGVIEAAVASSWLPENLTEERARSDLESAQAAIEDLRLADEAFRDLLAGSTLDVVLVSDYDTGSIALCRATSTGVEWLWKRGS
jgi:hypothetical protein